jgi:hypothetical protein
MEIAKDLKMIDASFLAVDEIARKPVEQSRPLRPQQPTTPVVERVPDSFVKAPIAIATSAWRIRAKVADSTGESKEAISMESRKRAESASPIVIIVCILLGLVSGTVSSGGDGALGAAFLGFMAGGPISRFIKALS